MAGRDYTALSSTGARHTRGVMKVFAPPIESGVIGIARARIALRSLQFAGERRTSYVRALRDFLTVPVRSR